jgi:CheY-like chemotaxis protein
MKNSPIEILLVEDNPDDVELTLKAFSKSKIANTVYVVNDGRQALDFIFGEGEYVGKRKKNTPRLILLDLKLPKIDGMEVLRQVKANPNTRTIPVVMLTSSREECDIVESYHLGVNSYIVKPVDFDQFLETAAKLGYYWLLLNQAPE